MMAGYLFIFFGRMYLVDCYNMGMDQYLLIPFLEGWTSIYQLFWCSPGVQGFDTLPYISIGMNSFYQYMKYTNVIDSSNSMCGTSTAYLGYGAAVEPQVLSPKQSFRNDERQGKGLLE